MNQSPASPFSFKSAVRLLGGHAPGLAVVQYTDRCNASCAQCGLRRQNNQPRYRLGIERAGALIDRLAADGVASLLLTGGETLVYLDDIAKLAARARRAGMVSVRTGTNGYFFRHGDLPGFEKKIALYADRLLAGGLTALSVSLDSPDPEVHERNRGLPGMIDGLRRGLPVFHKHGLYPTANLVLGRLIGGDTPLRAARGEEFSTFSERCETALDRFFAFALELGFTSSSVSYPMRVDGPAGYAPSRMAEADPGVAQLTYQETAAMLDALDRVVNRFRPRLRVLTPRSAIQSLLGSHGYGLRRGYGCLGGRGYCFVGSQDMRVSPCGYRSGEAMDAIRQRGRKAKAEESCDRCNWEIFRDPSNLIGPLLELRRAPLAAIRRLTKDPDWTRTWRDDLAYLKACGWGDGTTPPDMTQLAKFPDCGAK